MTKNTTTKTQPPYLSFMLVFICGLLAGVGLTLYKLDKFGGSPTGTTNQSANQPANQKTKEYQEAIARLEQEVSADPKNFQSWIQLGHLYFDSDQPEKAISAYTKSLEFHSGDANLLTDLGVMYRAVNQPDKAIASFDKARAMDPKHQPSRFNKGIVLLYDLHDSAGAIASWQELLTINPDAQTGNGQKVSDMLAELRKNPGQQESK